MTLVVVVNLILLFLIGFIQDALSALYLRMVNEQRPMFATVVAFIHSMLGWALWFWFFHQFQTAEQMGGLHAFMCSAGGAVGTYLGLRKPNSPKNLPA